MSLVLVTGGSGFVGSWCIVKLLAAGHRVRTTVRDLARAPEVMAMVQRGGPTPELDFVAADLTKDDGWADAVRGCDYVLHVASPIQEEEPAHEDELIVPAREGTLRVLRAARDAGVKRVVLTSSFAAIAYGKPEQTAPFDESSWTDTSTRGLTAYLKSKTIAERAAWDFIAKEGGALELVAVNPTGIFGPVLGADFSTASIVKRMLEGDGQLRFLPKLSFGVVDVRDVADLHVLLMTSPVANGQRYLCVSGEFMSLKQIAETLKRRLGAKADKVSTREAPSWLLRVVAVFKPEVRGVLLELDKHKRATNAKARALGWSPRSPEDALVATAESLFELGLVK